MKKQFILETILDEELVQRFEWLWINEKDTILMFGTEKLLITDELGITFINPFNLMQSMGKATLEDMRKQFNHEKDFEVFLLEKDNDFNTKILGNVEDKIVEYKGNRHVLRKYLWLKELLKWNMDPESSRIRFEHLLRPE